MKRETDGNRRKESTAESDVYKGQIKSSLSGNRGGGKAVTRRLQGGKKR